MKMKSAKKALKKMAKKKVGKAVAKKKVFANPTKGKKINSSFSKANITGY